MSKNRPTDTFNDSEKILNDLGIPPARKPDGSFPDLANIKLDVMSPGDIVQRMMHLRGWHSYVGGRLESHARRQLDLHAAIKAREAEVRRQAPANTRIADLLDEDQLLMDLRREHRVEQQVELALRDRMDSLSDSGSVFSRSLEARRQEARLIGGQKKD